MSLTKKITIGIGLALAIFTIMSCSNNDSRFSELPGFKTYFDKNKPSNELPSKSDQLLLTQFKPRVYMAKGQTKFIDFYADYIAHGSLYVDNKLVSNNVSQTLLNEYKDNNQAEFRHSAIKQTTSPTIYARIDRSELIYKDKRLPLTFLSYNLVFANSGLLKGLAGWQRVAMGIVGDNEDWHQLDHYVGLTVVLSEEKPIAIMLQQHNYQTTWLVADKNSEHSLRLPADQRVEVDVAMQSNELYLHSSQIKKHPGLSFVKEDSIEFLKTGENKPMMAGWDITHGEIEQQYALKFLPSADAFYTFKGKLGEGRKLPGRDGPPGANYVTLPPLMPLPNRMVSGYRPRQVHIEKKKIKALFGDGAFSIKPQGLMAYTDDFIGDLSIETKPFLK
ncbi:hypothetical protein GCM10009133_26890 [Cocleimonas flava]|uniref:Uncharacterized protein n=2 Tax=Cocleimonas flava TaxID=634765 RepID=A0A4V2P7U9_9GAMM|nr:hypothetical protein EV695_3965 [Cocleimonas flava]